MYQLKGMQHSSPPSVSLCITDLIPPSSSNMKYRAGRGMEEDEISRRSGQEAGMKEEEAYRSKETVRAE